MSLPSDNADESAPHSALYLNDERDAWWNADFLALLAQRLGLGRHDTGTRVRDVLDVGCGKGHWTRTIARLLPADARVIGVDREPEWIREATALEASLQVLPRLEFRVGDARALPFADASFDVVTCQAVLIHVADVVGVLGEMRRVLRPGGRIIAVEPNNLGESFAHVVGDPTFELEEALAFVRFLAICEKGKYALGLGYNSLGERLSGLVAQAGFVDVQAWNNDRVSAVITAGDRAHFEAGHLVWSKAETKRYFDAGIPSGAAVGVNPEAVGDFESLWSQARRTYGRRFDDETQRTDGSLFYVVTATSPKTTAATR
jgi:SAM-dependent methyltransferase